MNKGYSEDEALTIMTTGADFGITGPKWSMEIGVRM